MSRLVRGHCWSHTPYCWKSHVAAQLYNFVMILWRSPISEGTVSLSNPSLLNIVPSHANNKNQCIKNIPQIVNIIQAATCHRKQCGIWTSVDSDETIQPLVKFRNSKWFSVSSFTVIKYSSDWQNLWSDCAYAQAGLRLCWSHIPHCWISHFVAQLYHLGSENKTSIFVMIYQDNQTHKDQLACVTQVYSTLYQAMLTKKKQCINGIPQIFSIIIEPRHVIANNVAFWQVQTQTSLCSHFLSLETQNDIRSVA